MDIDTEAWIIATSHQFAWWLRQEAEMQEQGMTPYEREEWELEAEQSFAAGECPNCGHDWTAHSSFIARGEKVCEEFDPFLDERDYEDAHQEVKPMDTAEADEFTKTAHFCGECGRIYQWSADDIAWEYEKPFMPCGHSWRFLDMQIASECDIADELVAVILIQGPVTHTDEQPLCWDPECPCKQDIDVLKEQVFEPFFNGLLTAPEAHRFMEGKQL